MRCVSSTMLVAILLYSTMSSSTQSSLPPLDNALIVLARSMRQPTTQSPVELTLASGALITIPARDVHDYATTLLRAAPKKGVEPALLFVLHVRSVTSMSNTHSLVTLFSGTAFQVPTTDITDTRLTYLRTALSEARTGIRPGRSAHDAADAPGGSSAGGPRLDVANFCCPEYIETMIQRIRSNWDPQHGAAGQSIVKFSIRRDGMLTNVEIDKTSGNPLLDLESRKAVLRTQQLPPLPEQFDRPTLTVSLTFDYKR